MQLSNKTYDFLNIVVRYLLPGLGTFYFALSEIWGLPKPTEVLGTIAATSTFFGLVIAFARSGWVEDGSLVVDHRPDGVGVVLKTPKTAFGDLQDGQVLSVKVNRIPEESQEFPTL